jgi:hypothetical protein
MLTRRLYSRSPGSRTLRGRSRGYSNCCTDRSFDRKFWFGVEIGLNDVENPAIVQRSSRAGIPAAVPFVTRYGSVAVMTLISSK